MLFNNYILQSQHNYFYNFLSKYKKNNFDTKLFTMTKYNVMQNISITVCKYKKFNYLKIVNIEIPRKNKL